MTVQSDEKGIKELTLRECFDQVLARHMERLIGTPIGIGGLPLNLFNVASLILLTEQITEELENFSTPAERYTRSTLFSELCEMGIALDDDTESLLDDMIEKGYVEVNHEGGFSAKKPTISMAHVLDRAFPNMPGINLIASLAQTLDEVRGGSKDMEASVDRFDQILKMQGVPLITEKSAGKSERDWDRTPSGPTPESKASSQTITAPPPIEPLQNRKLSDSYSIQPPRMPRADPVTATAEPTHPRRAESFDLEEPDRDPDSLQETPVPETAPHTEAPFSGQGHEPRVETHASEPDADRPPGSAFAPLATPPPALDEDPAGTILQTEGGVEPSGDQDPEIEDLLPTPESRLTDFGLPQQEASIETFRAEDLVQTTTPAPEGKDEPQQANITTDDQDIEKRITEFENALSLQCPICRTGVVSREKTSTGKQFFKCTGVDCNFISWGKPFHIECPQCRNPFLVEATGRDGTPILKCPRATCAYWRKHASETEGAAAGVPSDPSRKLVRVRRGSGKGKRKVVRRRVVKKKH